MGKRRERSSQGTCIKDTRTKTTLGDGLNVGIGGVGRVSYSSGGKWG